MSRSGFPHRNDPLESSTTGLRYASATAGLGKPGVSCSLRNFFFTLVSYGLGLIFLFFWASCHHSLRGKGDRISWHYSGCAADKGLCLEDVNSCPRTNRRSRGGTMANTDSKVTLRLAPCQPLYTDHHPSTSYHCPHPTEEETDRQHKSLPAQDFTAGTGAVRPWESPIRAHNFSWGSFSAGKWGHISVSFTSNQLQ